MKTLSFVGSTTSSGATFTLHASAAAGDLAVVSDFATNASGSPTAVRPGGNWTQIGNVNTITAYRHMVHFRVLTAGDISTGTFTGMNGTSQNRKICLVFRPDFAVASAASANGTQQMSAANPSARSLVTTGVTAPAIALGMMCSDGAISPRTISPAMSEVAGAATNHYMHYVMYNEGATPDAYSYDMDDEGACNHLFMTYLTIAGATTYTVTASLNAAIQKTSTATATLNAAIRKAATASTSLNAAVRKSLTATAGINAAVQAPQSKTTSLNAAVQKAGSNTASLNAAVQKTGTAATSLDAAVKATRTASVGLDAALQQAMMETADLDAVIQKAGTADAAIDAAIQIGATVSAQLSAAIQAARTATASLDAVIEAAAAGGSITASLDAAIQAAGTVSTSLDAYVTTAEVVVEVISTGGGGGWKKRKTDFTDWWVEWSKARKLRRDKKLAKEVEQYREQAAPRILAALDSAEVERIARLEAELRAVEYGYRELQTRQAIDRMLKQIAAVREMLWQAELEADDEDVLLLVT